MPLLSVFLLMMIVGGILTGHWFVAVVLFGVLILIPR